MAMTVDEILIELNKLEKRYRNHITYSDHDDEFEWVQGVDAGYEYASNDLDELIRKIEGK